MGLIHQIDIAWPTLWNTILKWVSISTLLYSFSITTDANTTTSSNSFLDSRAHFLLLTILLPLALSFIMLIFAKPFYIILWFFVLLLGLGLLAAGGALILLDIGGVENRKILFGVGAACVVACICIFFVRAFVRRFQWRKKVEQLKNAMRAKRADRERERAREQEEREKEREREEGKETTTTTTSSSLSSSLSENDSPTISARNSGTLKPLISPSLIPPFQPPPARQLSRLFTNSPNITSRVLDREKEEEKEAFENAQKYKDKNGKRKGLFVIQYNISLHGTLFYLFIFILQDFCMWYQDC